PARSSYPRHRRPHPPAQALAQTRTRHHTASPPGDVELGHEQRACHDHRPPGGSRVVPAGRPRPSGHIVPPYADSRTAVRSPAVNIRPRRVVPLATTHATDRGTINDHDTCHPAVV